MSKKIVLIICIMLFLYIPISVMGATAVTAPCIAGKWNYPQDKQNWKGTMTITQKGNAVTGTLKSGGWTKVFSGKFSSQSVASGTFKLTPKAANGKFTFTVDKNGKTISISELTDGDNSKNTKYKNTMTKISASKCS